MAGLRRTQDIDQWRPEEPSIRDRERPRERSRGRIIDTRPSSPRPRAARDSSRRRTHDSDTRPPAKQHPRDRSREESLGRERTRRRSRGDSREERSRRSRRDSSSDRVSHARRHDNHHHHHRHPRDTTPSSKRHRSRSPSPKGSHKRTRRNRSRSTVRSRSRTRRANSTHRPAQRAYSPPPQRSDRDRAPRRPTPDTYIPLAPSRRRSPSVESYYRPLSHRTRRRSISPDRRSTRVESPRRSSPRRSHRQPNTPFEEPRERSYKHSSAHARERSRSRVSRRARSRTPPRRQSPAAPRRRSPPNSRRGRASPGRSRSPHASSRRRLSQSPSHATRLQSGSDKEFETKEPARADRLTSRRGSPAPTSGNVSDTVRGKEEDDKMRGAYHYQGHGGYSHSPPYPPQNQYSPPGQSPYPGGRGGWNGQGYPNQG